MKTIGSSRGHIQSNSVILVSIFFVPGTVLATFKKFEDAETSSGEKGVNLIHKHTFVVALYTASTVLGTMVLREETERKNLKRSSFSELRI